MRIADGILTSSCHYSTTLQAKDDVTVNFIEADGNKVTLKVPEGTSILEAAHQNGIDLEGACEASLACSTCHVYVDEKYFDKLPTPEEEEEDMLDLAYGLTSLSRLGCQIICTKDLDGITVTIPSKTRNMLLEQKKK
jgi:ferredoxin